MAEQLPTSHPRILVAGLGNELLSDDGVGVHAARLLREQAPSRLSEGIVVAEVGTAVGDAMELLEWADFVLAIDAMQAGGRPGTLYRALEDDLEGDGRSSLHQLSLLGALRLVQQEVLGRAAQATGQTAPSERWQRPRVEILGVEPASLELGMGLSPAVRDALPAVAAEAWRVIDRWKAKRHAR